MNDSGHSGCLRMFLSTPWPTLNSKLGSSSSSQSKVGLRKKSLGNCGASLSNVSFGVFGFSTTALRVALSLLCDRFSNKKKPALGCLASNRSTDVSTPAIVSSCSDAASKLLAIAVAVFLSIFYILCKANFLFN